MMSDEEAKIRALARTPEKEIQVSEPWNCPKAASYTAACIALACVVISLISALVTLIKFAQ